MTPLPLWADTAECRTLLAAIRIEQPDCWMIRRFGDVPTRYPKFQGANARELRRIWQEQRDKAVEANDRPTFSELGEVWPDDLIAQMLDEPVVPYTRMSIDLREDGGRIAA